MKFYLQQGHGMMSLNKEFVEKHPDTGVILSPRNGTRDQIERHAKELHDNNAEILFDPQFYQPRTDREKILNYPYWEDLSFSTQNFAANGAKKLCEGVIRYQINVLDVSKVILPGRYTNIVSEDWLNTHYAFAEAASMELGRDKPIFSSLAIGPDIIMDRESLDRVLNEVVNYPIDGVYIVVKNPRDFLVTDDLFIYNLLDGILSISLSGKQIILGYANQQSLIYAGAGVTGFATGNFRNVRSFDPDTFDVQEQLERQRSTWYYDADTLSEFRLQSLGLAYQRGLAGSFGPECEYCSPLLSAQNPANVLWKEPLAFRHFLTEIRKQWLNLSTVSRNKRIDSVIEVVENAEAKLRALSEKGFYATDRTFRNSFDATLNALKMFKNDRISDISVL